MKKRMLTGKKTKLTPEEREEKIAQKQDERDKFEKQNLNSYKLIYPCATEEKTKEYDIFIETAK